MPSPADELNADGVLRDVLGLFIQASKDLDVAADLLENLSDVVDCPVVSMATVFSGDATEDPVMIQARERAAALMTSLTTDVRTRQVDWISRTLVDTTDSHATSVWLVTDQFEEGPSTLECAVAGCLMLTERTSPSEADAPVERNTVLHLAFGDRAGGVEVVLRAVRPDDRLSPEADALIERLVASLRNVGALDRSSDEPGPDRQDE